MTEPLEPRHLITAGSFLVGGVVLGYVLYRLIVSRLDRDVTISRWGGYDVLVGAIRRLVVAAFALAGAYLAVVTLPLREEVARPIERGLVSLLIVAATMVAARVGGDLVKLYALRRAGVLAASSIFVNVTRLVVYVIGFLVLLQSLGVSITPLLTALGVGGLAVALALQDTLANLFAGLHILGSRKLNPGDYIQLDTGEEGYVVDINWRNTTIRSLPNNMVVVPNAKLASAIVTNFYVPEQELAVRVDMGVSYDSDLEKVERATVEVAREVQREVEGAVPEFDPFIRYHTFGEYSVWFTVILRGREYRDQFLMKHEFVKRLLRRYRDEGIEIPFPVRTVHLWDADETLTRGEPDGAAASGSGPRSSSAGGTRGS